MKHVGAARELLVQALHERGHPLVVEHVRELVEVVVADKFLAEFAGEHGDLMGHGRGFTFRYVE